MFTKSLGIVLVAFILLAVSVTPAIGKDKRIVICSIPYTVEKSGSYVLAKSLSVKIDEDEPVDAAITVDASNVVIDFMGYTLDGLAFAARGIQIINGSKNVIIRNGTLTGFVVMAIQESNVGPVAGQHQVIDMVIAGVPGQGSGVNLMGPDSRVHNSKFINISDDAVRMGVSARVTHNRIDADEGMAIDVGNRATVIGNVANTSSESEAVKVGNESLVRNNKINARNTALTMGQWGKAAHNMVVGEQGSAIRAFSYSQISDNTVQTDTIGISVFGEGSSIDGNYIVRYLSGSEADGINFNAASSGNQYKNNSISGLPGGIELNGTLQLDGGGNVVY